MWRPVLVSVSALIVVGSACGEMPVDIGGNKQLFIDNRFIAASENVRIQMNQAQKLGMIQMDDGSHMFDYVSRVIEDGGKIRLYVGASGVTVLESDDGIHFRRTGTTINKGAATTIFLDDHDPDPARRYKVFWTVVSRPPDLEHDGVYAAFGADGVNYTDVGRVLPFFCDNPTIVHWDPRIEKYVIYTRAFVATGENQRQVARLETEAPLAPWPFHGEINAHGQLTPDNAEVVLKADEQDDPFSDIYYNAATRYPWAQDVYLMFTAQFRHYGRERHPFIRPRPGVYWEDYGPLEIQVALSRDGIHWKRPVRDPYFPTGLADEWDRWYAVMAPGVVRRGNYLYQYYVSSGRAHDSVILRPEYDEYDSPGGIGVVRQRLDGFFSADVDHRGGWLETPPVRFSGNRLRLNIDTGAMGTAFVELRDAEGNPIPGYTLAECEEVGGNFIDQTVYWSGKHDVAALAGTPVKLYFKITRGKLYAFQFTEE